MKKDKSAIGGAILEFVLMGCLELFMELLQRLCKKVAEVDGAKLEAAVKNKIF